MVGDQRTTGPGGLPAPPELLAAPGYVARRLHQAYVAAWVRMVDATLTGPQFAVLTAVNAYPGVEQGNLARAVALDRSTMASIVRRLEDRGLITREKPAADGRKRMLTLTAAGAEALADADRRARELDVVLMQGYDAPRQESILRELTKLSEHWESLVED
ncbi:MarR family winged helix-turn-helix transcriptional regulator [Pseudonocardia sp. GCM10023141]|uniref:MarR family winged helix-turn-helix transcriptional regulator n=1 Tax=Pseudonocardia sp. GCM10023141 TaxID=3252653 RepID=UPI003613F053